MTVATLTGLATAATAQGQSTEAVLAHDGRALLPIVIPEDAGERLRTVANDLAAYLGRMSGATFEVKTGLGGDVGIMLGTLEQFPSRLVSRDMADALAIRNRFDGKEAYVIRTAPRRVVLLGAEDWGASHAAYRLLEEFGCRWFFPAREWEVIPDRRDLRIDLAVDDRPAILARRIWYQWGYLDREQGRCGGEHATWRRRNRMASSISINCGHAWDHVISVYKDLIKAHPEYLALRDGERGGNKFCVSNPAVIDLYTRYALDYFAKNPDADMVSADPSDGGGHCECENCAAMGKVSNRVFHLANEVAKAVDEKYPGKMVGLYAYNLHSEPPDFELAPNVYVQLTSGFIRGQYSYDELFELWPKKCRNMGFYEYYSVYQWNGDMLPGGNGGNVGHHRRRIPEFHHANATSIDAESGNNWGPHGRGYIVANRLMWNPKADVDSITEDFYMKAFGPAADVMQRYYERVAPENSPIISNHLLGLAFRDIHEATELAKDRPDVLARLDHLKIYLRYVHLKWMLGREQDKARSKDLWEQLFTHVYRNRYTYMNHWEAIRQFQTRVTAKAVDEPTWHHSGPEAPWIGKAPNTRQEIAAFFAEGLEYFKPQEIDERAYSDDLVPVRFVKGHARPNAPTPAGFFQGGFRSVMYSIAGEPLEVTVTTGRIAWYRDRAQAKYTFTDEQQEVILEGRLPLDGQKHAIRCQVPTAGLYFFDFNDSGAGWTKAAAGDQPLTIPLRKSGFTHHGWGKNYYFYVPKGLKNVTYYFDGGAHKIIGPDGKLVREVENHQSGTYITIPVPDGMDGTIWRFKQIALSKIWFTNVPNYLAGTPNALMIPREVAEADGLEVREGYQPVAKVSLGVLWRDGDGATVLAVTV
ncbi:MAG: hypothetical protein CMJ49_09905, partial [Planctomycetaceae bacterium]|nr:hypothetical protein [Planctomycetaceae bacterium]